MDTFTHRHRLQSATPTPFVNDATETTIAPKEEYFGISNITYIHVPKKQASERSSAANIFPNSMLPNPPSIPDYKPRNADEINKQIRKLFVLKKIISKSKSPESLDPPKNNEVQVKPLNIKDPLPTPTLQLNELITLKKIKTSITNGVVKRMLHAPSFRIYDIQVLLKPAKHEYF